MKRSPETVSAGTRDEHVETHDELTELGTVTDLTLGSSGEDTADMKKYYY